MKHILVTGGNGFIGRYVIEELDRRGYQPSVFDRKFVEDPRAIFGDIKDPALVDDAISHVDGVIHLAGILGTQETVADPVPAATTNILGGLNVVVACAKYDIPLVNIAVGNHWMHNTYSITKSTIERFVKMKHRFEGKSMTSVRGLNAYGPRQVPAAPFGPSRVRKIMPSFICRALSGEAIEIYGDGKQIMDMIYVEDLARILVQTLEHVDAQGPPEHTVQAGTGRETSVNDVADEVVIDVEIQAEKKVRITHLPMRPGEPEHSIVLADPETLLQVGIDPATLTKLEKGVAMTVSYYMGYLKSHESRP